MILFIFYMKRGVYLLYLFHFQSPVNTSNNTTKEMVDSTPLDGLPIQSTHVPTKKQRSPLDGLPMHSTPVPTKKQR